MNHRYTLISLCLSLYLGLLSGCSTSYVAPASNSLIQNRCYSYAVYNDQGRLLSHPIKDFENNMAFAELKNDPYTDIYIVSHGWNYDLQESITGYQKYIDQINKLMSETKDQDFSCEHRASKKTGEQMDRRKRIKPFFIFVSWPSATRPLTSLLSSILPFGLDDALKPVSLVLDNVAFFLPTAWKQSINATKISLGTRFPNAYLFSEWEDQYYGAGSLRENMGRDTPLSLLVYQLLKKVYPHESSDPTNKSKGKFKIHMVGHSYGAKVAMLSAIESLRQWQIHQEYANRFDTYRLKYEDCSFEFPERPTIESARDILSHCSQEEREEEEKSIRKRIFDERKRQSLDEINSQIKFGAIQPKIESLILFNPAFRPGELSYVYDSFPAFDTKEQDDLYTKIANTYYHDPSGPCRLQKPGSIKISCETEILLARIVRKAIVFSDTDRANGPLFSLSQLVLNNAVSQNASRYTSDMKDGSPTLPPHEHNPRKAFPSIDRNEGLQTILDFPRLLIDGGQALVGGVISAPLIWAAQLGPTALGYSGLDSSLLPHQVFFGKLLQQSTHQNQSTFCSLSSGRIQQDLPIPFRISPDIIYSFDGSEIFRQPFTESFDPFIGSHGDLRSTELTTCNSKHVKEKKIWKDLAYKIQAMANPKHPSREEFVALLGGYKNTSSASDVFPETQFAKNEITQNNILIPPIPEHTEGDKSQGPRNVVSGMLPPHSLPQIPRQSDNTFGTKPQYSPSNYRLNIHFPKQDIPLFLDQQNFDFLRTNLNNGKGIGESHIVMKDSGYELFTIDEDSVQPTFTKHFTYNPEFFDDLLQDPLDGISEETIRKCNAIFREDEETFELVIAGEAREIIWECMSHKIVNNETYLEQAESLTDILEDIELDAVIANTTYIRASDEPYEVNPQWLTHHLLPAHPDEFVDFIKHLADPGFQQSRYVHDHLSPKTRQQLAKVEMQLSNSKLAIIRNQLTNDLKTIIEEDSFHDRHQFSNIRMSPTTLKMWRDLTAVGAGWRSDGHDLAGKDRMLLNQYLLVDSFPSYLSNESLTYYQFWKNQGLNQYGPKLVTYLKELLARDITRICVLPKLEKRKKRDHTLNFVLNFSLFQCAEGQDCRSSLSNAFKVVDASELACYSEPPPALTPKLASSSKMSEYQGNKP